MQYIEDKNGEPMPIRKFNLRDESDYYDWQCQGDPDPDEECSKETD